MEQLKTQDFASACEVMGIDPNLSFDHLPEPYSTRSLKSHKRDVIADGINKEIDFVIEYTHDSNQQKFIPLFRKNSSGRWVCNDFSRTHYLFTVVGSRIVFKNYEAMRHFVEIVLKEDLMDE